MHEFAALPPLRLATAEMLGPGTDPAANGLWTGSGDVGVETWTAWDDTHFHLAVRVRDDQHVQSHAGADIWRQDCLQIAFDPLNNALPPRFSGRTGFDSDDHEFGLALTPKGPLMHRWAGAAPAQSEARLAIKRRSETTTYEWAVVASFVSTPPDSPGAIVYGGIFTISLSPDGLPISIHSQSTASGCGNPCGPRRAPADTPPPASSTTSYSPGGVPPDCEAHRRVLPQSGSSNREAARRQSRSPCRPYCQSVTTSIRPGCPA